MSGHTLSDLSNEHAYLSQNLVTARQQAAQLYDEIRNKVAIAKATGRKKPNVFKLKRSLKQCRGDEQNLVWSLSECETRIQALNRYQLAVQYARTPLLWSVSQQGHWMSSSPYPSGTPWTTGFSADAMHPITTAAAALVPFEGPSINSQPLAYPYVVPAEDHKVESNAMVANAPYDLAFPGYATPSLYRSTSSSPALNPTAPEFKLEDTRSDGFSSMSLSVSEPSASHTLFAGAVQLGKEADRADQGCKDLEGLRTMHGTQPTLQRNKKPAPLVHHPVMRIKSSALRCIDELISPKTIPQPKRHHSEAAIEPTEDQLNRSAKNGIKTAGRKVTFSESPHEQLESIDPLSPLTPMKGNKRGAKSELPRALKRIDEEGREECDKTEADGNDDFTGQGSYGNGDLHITDMMPGEEVVDDEKQYVGYGIVWNWENGGTVWPKTPLPVEGRH